jgi:hypothetical protein
LNLFPVASHAPQRAQRTQSFLFCGELFFLVDGDSYFFAGLVAKAVGFDEDQVVIADKGNARLPIKDASGSPSGCNIPGRYPRSYRSCKVPAECG